jgi:hypothetical protein
MDKQAKRIAELKKEVNQRGYSPHVAILKDIAELPPELQSPSIATFASREAIQTIVVFPPQIQRGWYYVPQQALLFTSARVIHTLASIWPRQEPQVTSLDACGLLYMNVTLQLLYGVLEFVGQGPDVPVRLSLEFNTVAWNCLSRPLRQFLQAAQVNPGSGEDQCSYSPTVLPALEKLPMKFSNGVRIYGLLPGEEVQELAFQARAWKRWLHFFRRPLSPNILLMLTSNYIVVIQEELEVEQGWLLSYIPRQNIIWMQNRPCGPWQELCICLQREDQMVDYKLVLQSETLEIWHGQWIQQGGMWQDEVAIRQIV